LNSDLKVKAESHDGKTWSYFIYVSALTNLQIEKHDHREAELHAECQINSAIRANYNYSPDLWMIKIPIAAVSKILV